MQYVVTFPELDLKRPFDRSALPNRVGRLVGNRIRVRGFMLPSFQQTGIKEFVVVRDNIQESWATPLPMYDAIIVKMKAATTATFVVNRIEVEGKLTIQELHDPDKEDELLAVYQLDEATLRP